MIQSRCFSSLTNLAAVVLLSAGTPYSTNAADPVVAGYYPYWVGDVYAPEAVPFDCLTHVMHAFVWPSSDGTLEQPWQFGAARLVAAAHRAGKKAVVSVGGWGQSDGFSSMAADSVSRSTFVQNLAAFCIANGYDGADIDWEFPANSLDRRNLNRLVLDLRSAFDASGRDLLVTLAVPAGNWGGQWFDFTTLAQSADWLGCMTYDFFGSWSPRAGHNSPLHPPAQNDNGSVEAAVKYLCDVRGVQASKVLTGIPFYGRGCDAAGYDRPNRGGNTEYAYSEIVPLIGNGWSIHWDAVAQVPFLTDTGSTRFISYDDTTSVRLKCEYTRSEELAGVMVWALGQDRIGDDQPLLETVGRSMGIKGGIPETTDPSSIAMLNNYPNPFNRQTVLSFALPGETKVRIEVFNTRGERVAIAFDGTAHAGLNAVSFDAGDLASGVYAYRLTGPAFKRTGKMTLIR